MARFVNKVALVTGASSGIGAATALLLAKEGAHLIITGRKSEQLHEVAEICYSETWNRPHTICADLTVEDETKRMLQSSVGMYKRLDTLINCAGVFESGSVENTSTNQLERILSVNVRGLYNLITSAVPYLIESRGNVVNVSSINGLQAVSNMLAYNVSKSAVNQLTQSVALELAEKGVRVNAVNPGIIITELHNRGGYSLAEYRKQLLGYREKQPLGRPGFPQEVAEAIAFLASDQSSFITGVLLPVDGGRHVM